MIVVLFSITMREDASVEEEEEEAESEWMWAIVSSIPGFISYKAYTAADGETIAVVRFEPRAALDAWKLEPHHRRTQVERVRSFASSTGSRPARPSGRTDSPGRRGAARSPSTFSWPARVSPRRPPIGRPNGSRSPAHPLR